jgi:peptidoglycan/LPS O-acetylase OafA/YrhL
MASSSVFANLPDPQDGLPLLEVVPKPLSGPRFYRPELDALRFLAFLLVFLTHQVSFPGRTGFSITGGGRSGVCLFFMLSAYLITELLEREVERTNTVGLRSFYIRRILRIWPLYFFALLLARLLDLHVPHVQMSNGRLVASLLLAGNWYTYFYGLPASFMLVLWSVSVEEQFYLFWPSVRKFFGRNGLLALCVFTFPMSYGSIIWLCSRGTQDFQLWVNTFVQIQFFGLGGLLALILRGKSPRLPLLARAGLFAAGLYAFFASQYFSYGLTHGTYSVPTISNATIEYLMMLVGSALLFFSVLGFAELRHAKFLTYLGKISYGLYVFHLLAMRITLRLPHPRSPIPSAIFQWTVALALTFVIAHFSYVYLESTFLRFKENFAVIKTRSV